MNNKILDIYENKDGHLVLKVYNYTTGKVEALMRDEEVEVFLRKIEHYPVIEEKEEIRNNKEFDIVITNQGSLNDVNKILKIY